MNFLSILNKPDLSLTRCCCCCCCWVATQQPARPLSHSSFIIRKKKRRKRKVWQARSYTHPNIYTEGGAGATLNPPKRFLSAASFFLFSFYVLFEVPARRLMGGKGYFAIKEKCHLYCTLSLRCVHARVPLRPQVEQNVS